MLDRVWLGLLLRSAAGTMGLLRLTWGDLIGERFGLLIIRFFLHHRL
jgi:hypothetical protein